jgi:hypothetical protein
MSIPQAQPLKINRVAKGKRPHFYPEEPAAERLLAIVSALITEVAVLRERVDPMERIADKKGVVLTGEIEGFTPDAKALEERERWRQAYMDRVLAILDQEAAA